MNSGMLTVHVGKPPQSHPARVVRRPEHFLPLPAYLLGRLAAPRPPYSRGSRRVPQGGGGDSAAPLYHLGGHLMIPSSSNGEDTLILQKGINHLECLERNEPW